MINKPSRDYTKYAYYTIALDKNGELNRRIIADAMQAGVRQLPTFIRSLLMRYYEIKDIRGMLENMQFQAVSQPDIATPENVNSKVEDALEAWGNEE